MLQKTCRKTDDGRRVGALGNALINGAVVATAATVGTLATDTDSVWYKNLEKPPWQPKPVVFPIAWTALYAGVAAGVTRAADKLEERGESAWGLRWCLARNMVLNACWTVLFFQKKNLPAATAGAAMLALSSTVLAVRTAKADSAAAIPVATYAAWTFFATGLTAEIWRLNRS